MSLVVALASVCCQTSRRPQYVVVAVTVIGQLAVIGRVSIVVDRAVEYTARHTASTSVCNGMVD